MITCAMTELDILDRCSDEAAEDWNGPTSLSNSCLLHIYKLSYRCNWYKDKTKFVQYSKNYNLSFLLAKGRPSLYLLNAERQEFSLCLFSILISMLDEKISKMNEKKLSIVTTKIAEVLDDYGNKVMEPLIRTDSNNDDAEK